MLAHNEDDWGERIVNWYKVPAMNHKEGSMITLKNGAGMDQANKTYSYLWLEMPEMEFSDSYMNEWGVTISSDACPSKEKKGEITDGGIGYWLRRAMAERAKTATGSCSDWWSINREIWLYFFRKDILYCWPTRVLDTGSSRGKTLGSTTCTE